MLVKMAKMPVPEKQLYERIVRLAKEADQIVTEAMEMDPTIELCVFTGKLSAVLDILMALDDAGVPVPDQGEEPHPLEEKPS
jgi:hypothetical protein